MRAISNHLTAPAPWSSSKRAACKHSRSKKTEKSPYIKQDTAKKGCTPAGKATATAVKPRTPSATAAAAPAPSVKRPIFKRYSSKFLAKKVTFLASTPVSSPVKCEERQARAPAPAPIYCSPAAVQPSKYYVWQELTTKDTEILWRFFGWSRKLRAVQFPNDTYFSLSGHASTPDIPVDPAALAAAIDFTKGHCKALSSIKCPYEVLISW
jgi:hypothetical protein